MHAALALPATLAALGAIFQASPTLCPCEPRFSPEEMQTVPSGARSNIRLFPASTSHPSPAGIRSVRKYNTGICTLFKQKRSLHSNTSSYPAIRKINSQGQPRPQTLSLLPRRAAAHAAGELRPAYPCLRPRPRTHVGIRGGNGPGRRTPKPHTNPIHICTAATTAVCCCHCCCCCAAVEVN